jgi:hypothetical protein
MESSKVGRIGIFHGTWSERPLVITTDQFIRDNLKMNIYGIATTRKNIFVMESRNLCTVGTDALKRTVITSKYNACVISMQLFCHNEAAFNLYLP